MESSALDGEGYYIKKGPEQKRAKAGIANRNWPIQNKDYTFNARASTSPRSTGLFVIWDCISSSSSSISREMGGPRLSMSQK